MFNPDSISRTDIVSIGVEGKSYIEGNAAYTAEYDRYSPDSQIMEKIDSWMQKNDELLDIQAFGAPWCGDCRVQLPRLVKISQMIPANRIILGFHTEIKVNPPSQRKPGAVIWRSPPSPPEALNPEFDMYHIPAIFLFLKSGKCIGKIDERPSHTSTLEGDIWYYLTK